MMRIFHGMLVILLSMHVSSSTIPFIQPTTCGSLTLLPYTILLGISDQLAIEDLSSFATASKHVWRILEDNNPDFEYVYCPLLGLKHLVTYRDIDSRSLRLWIESLEIPPTHRNLQISASSIKALRYIQHFGREDLAMCLNINKAFQHPEISLDHISLEYVWINEFSVYNLDNILRFFQSNFTVSNLEINTGIMLIINIFFKDFNLNINNLTLWPHVSDENIHLIKPIFEQLNLSVGWKKVIGQLIVVSSGPKPRYNNCSFIE